MLWQISRIRSKAKAASSNRVKVANNKSNRVASRNKVKVTSNNRGKAANGSRAAIAQTNKSNRVESNNLSSNLVRADRNKVRRARTSSGNDRKLSNLNPAKKSKVRADVDS